jgi:hypothetical protein
MEIAADHLVEHADYYQGLEKMEKKLEQKKRSERPRKKKAKPKITKERRQQIVNQIARDAVRDLYDE